MKYSLIIPHFNDPERLERLLRTVPTDRTDLEVLVVDDCSPEQEGLQSLRSRWTSVCWLSTPENSGAGVARNVGLNKATGNWLVFADSDDEFLPDAFATFDEVLDDEDQLVYFLGEAVQERDGTPSNRADGYNVLVRSYAMEPCEKTLRQLRLGHVTPYCKIYRRSFIESFALRFDPVSVSNDVAFNVLAAVQASNIRAETIPIYRIYRRGGSLTANVSRETFLTRFEVSRSLAERLSKLGVEKVRPATGYMVAALSYGPRVTARVWQQAIASPMLVEWSRVINISRWLQFFNRRRQLKKEQSNNL